MEFFPVKFEVGRDTTTKFPQFGKESSGGLPLNRDFHIVAFRQTQCLDHCGWDTDSEA
ncbi:hypothetical protein AGMMS50256_31770 [Betaproteobacteria bacterium]|nr:hypothetical protein AGMMS50256_31770 [Betaproteobacteria bacterium]